MAMARWARREAKASAASISSGLVHVDERADLKIAVADMAAGPLWPLRTAIALPVVASQSRAVLSRDAVTMRDPSGLKAAEVIARSGRLRTAVASLVQAMPAGASAQRTPKASRQPASPQILPGLVHFAIQDRFSVAMMSSQSLMKLDKGGPLFRSSRRRAVAR